MTDRTRRDASSGTDAQLTGLIPRLTWPSRNHDDLVDIWFSVECRERSTEWDEAFVRLANGRRPDPRHPSYFDLFSHRTSSALIAARRVSAAPAVWDEVEMEARRLVGEVNRAVAEGRATPPITSRRSGWSVRARPATPISGATPSSGVPRRGWLLEAGQLVRSIL